MAQYCRSILSDGRYIFPCPYVDSSGTSACNQRWDFFLVCHVARFSVDERKEFEKMIIEKYVNKAEGIQKCPGCLNFCRRKESKSNRVLCFICSKNKNGSFEFCWVCMGEWKASDAGANQCGNDHCDGTDQRLQTLAKCVTKRMAYSNQECPMIRGCPKCGMLIEHKEACKHMNCPSCRHSFCFVCLKGKKSDGKTWECGAAFVICTLASRQSELPGSK